MGEARKSTRRDFLQGKAAADALADRMESALGDGADGVTAPEGYLLQFSRRAMACEFAFYFNADVPQRPMAEAYAALDLIDQLEGQLTIYRDTSEVSAVNRLAYGEAVSVEPRLFDLLALAVRLHDETGGAYDVTAGPLVRAWGFVRRAGAMLDEATLAEVRQRVGSQWLQLDPRQRSVRFLRPEMEINLGSIGKGYALDRAAEQLLAAGVNDFLLHGGQSSVLARGSCIEPGHRDAWQVGLRDPYRPQRRLGQIRLCDRALGTSGSGTQFFMHEGRRYGHILDPRSGWPASGVLSATALAPAGAEADALATAFYVLGPEGTAAYCAAHPDVASILICPGKREGEVRIETCGLEEGDFTSYSSAHAS